MNKYLLLIFSVCFISISACSSRGIFSNSNTMIQNSKFYKIYENNITDVIYEIYDINNEIMYSDSTENPLKIDMLNNTIIDVSIGMGTGITIHKYFDIENRLVSDEYSYVLANYDNLVAYIDVPKENSFENRKIAVHNKFDKNVFYKEFDMDFSDVDTPITYARFIENGKVLEITYLSGANQIVKSILLNLET